VTSPAGRAILGRAVDGDGAPASRPLEAAAVPFLETRMETPVTASARTAPLLGRREALQVGSLGALGLCLPLLLRGRAQAAAVPDAAAAAGAERGFGKARSAILIFQWGGPSQLDTWDLKPDAPSEIRGEFRPIPTTVPGTQVSEHFPRLARLAHRYAIVRSVTHRDPAHLSSAHHLLTGHLAPKPFSDADGPSQDDFPHMGSVLARFRPAPGTLPSFVTVPWTVMHPAAPGGRAPGQNGGWLGRRYDPLAIDGDPGLPGFRVSGLEPLAQVSPERLARRRRLLSALNGDTAGEHAALREFRGFQERALEIVGSRETRAAFDTSREDERTRDRYGRNIHGSCLLLARRLVERGVPLVTVNWHNDGQNFWDTHGDNFNQLKNRLMPPADLGFSALIEDLEARGLLEETIVVWMGEFGRTPRITRGNAGREHWPHCYSVVLAGGGIQGGQVHGASDGTASYPAEKPVAPGSIAATVYHALGIPETAELHDRLERPRKIREAPALVELF
jgi:hypothetical protein